MWRSHRDRLLTSPGLQRLALRWPFLRGIARRRALGLFDLCAGFIYSQVLRAVVELRLCERVAERERSIADLATHAGLSVAETQRLVRAAASLKLLEQRSGDAIGLGALGAALIGNPMVRAMVLHHELAYADLADPVTRLKQRNSNTHLGTYWAYTQTHATDCAAPQTAPYNELMSASQSLVADEIIAAYPADRHRSWLDIGGGNGELLIRLARAHPDIVGTVFDIPAVAQQATLRISDEGLSHRLRALGGDIFRTPLPGDHEAALLVRVLHDHDDDAVARILAATHAALVPGARLIVAEPMSDDGHRNRVADAYFGFYLLAMGQGRPRTAQELGALLEHAGFRVIRNVATRMPMLLSVLVAERMPKVKKT